jgi:hypothetical protein
MAKSSRDKYKPAKLAELRKKVSSEDAIVGTFSGSDFLEITEGKSNKFRLLPAHEGVDYYIVRKRYWLTLDGEDGDPIRRTVLDSRVHGGTKKDLVDEYLKYCKSNVTNKDTIDAINHWKDGLKANHDFIAYAVKLSKDGNEFGLLSFKKTVRDAINKATFVEDDDEPIEVDPFTDLDDGLPLIIKYNSKPNKKKGEDYYDVQVGKKAVAISDEDFDAFDAAKSLVELYKGVYTANDFETALEGLKWFDAEHEVDAFDDDEFLEIIEEIKAQISDKSDDEDEEEKPKRKKKSKPEPEEDEDEDSDDEDEDADDEDSDDEDEDSDDEDEDEDSDDEDEDEDSDDDDGLDDMSRKELKQYIKENELDVKVKKSWDDSDIVEAIRGAESDDDDDDDDDEDGEMGMDAIRARLKKKG